MLRPTIGAARWGGCHELIRSAGCSARTAWFKHGCCAVVSCSIVCFARALASQRDSVDAHRVLRPQPRAAPITRACEGLSDSRHDTYYKLGSRHAREGNRSADSTIITATITIRSCPVSPFINPPTQLAQPVRNPLVHPTSTSLIVCFHCNVLLEPHRRVALSRQALSPQHLIALSAFFPQWRSTCK